MPLLSSRLRLHAVALLSLGFLAACGSGTKTLNEASAKRMLIDQLKTKGDTFPVPLNFVATEIRSPTREDYLAGSYGESGPKASVQRLLKAGYISQTREDTKLINVTGTYKAEPAGCGSGGAGIGKQVYTFTLSMQPSYAAVSGDYTYESWYSSGQHSASFNGRVTGEVRPEGVATLAYGPMSARRDYTIKAEGANVTLAGPRMFACDSPVVATGTGPGGFIMVPKYTYAYSDKLKPLLDPAGNLKGGTIKIDEVHNLLLETDAIATAQFAMHIDFNDAGAAVLGKTTMADKGNVTFRRQPDGTWVLPLN